MIFWKIALFLYLALPQFAVAIRQQGGKQIQGPHISALPNKNLWTGETLTLSCKVDVSEDYIVFHRGEGGFLISHGSTLLTQDNRFDLKLLKYESSKEAKLQVVNVEPSDSGEYSCFTSGGGTSTISINVFDRAHNDPAHFSSATADNTNYRIQADAVHEHPDAATVHGDHKRHQRVHHHQKKHWRQAKDLERHPQHSADGSHSIASSPSDGGRAVNNGRSDADTALAVASTHPDAVVALEGHSLHSDVSHSDAALEGQPLGEEGQNPAHLPASSGTGLKSRRFWPVQAMLVGILFSLTYYSLWKFV